MTKATEAITAERERQIAEEGYDAAHDRMHGHQLMAAAMCYLTAASHPHPSDLKRAPIGWPWAERFWKPAGGRKRNLVKAGALIAAALDSMTEGDEYWRIHARDVPTSAERVCTCPSGDGSLRWPCPVHPPAESAEQEQSNG